MLAKKVSILYEKIKANWDLVLFAIVVIVLVSLPLFQNTIYRAQDLHYHLSRLDGIVDAVKDGQFPLAIYPYKNFGYGYASPLFYSDLLLVVPALVAYFLNVPLIITFKFIVVSFVAFNIISATFCTYDLFKNKIATIIAVITYAFCCYYLNDLYVRAALGEIMGIAFLPLLLHSAYEFIYQHKNNYLRLGVLFALILHCHNITFFMAVLVFGILLIINFKTILLDKERFIALVKAVVVGVGLSAIFLFPMLEQYLSQDLNVHHVIYKLQDHLVPFNKLFYDFAEQFEYQYNNFNLIDSYTNSQGLYNSDIYKNLGIFITLTPLIYLFIRNKSKFINQLFFIFILSIILSLGLLPLHKIELFDFIQFASRFYIVTIVLALYIIAYTFSKISFKGSITFLVIISILNLYNVSFLYETLFNDNLNVKIPQNATANELFIERKYAKPGSLGSDWNREELMNGEYLPYVPGYSFLEKNGYIMWPNFEPLIYDYKRSGTTVNFTSNLNNNSHILMPMTWYKGYTAYEVDENGNKLKEILVAPEMYSGNIVFEIESDKRNYLVEYVGTKVQKVASLMTIVSLIGVIYIKIKKD